MNKNLFVILGNQLFDPQYLKDNSCSEVYMSEKIGLSKYVKYHKLKIYLFLCAMREYRDELEKNGIKVYYFSFDKRKTDKTYFDLLKIFIDDKNISKLNFFEIEDKGFEEDFFNQLNFNKIGKNIVKQTISIDSRHRNNYYETLSSSYSINLAERQKDVLEMAIVAVEMPMTFYSISDLIFKYFSTNKLYWHFKVDKPT